MADFEKVYQIKFDTKQAEAAIKNLQKGLGGLTKKAKKASNEATKSLGGVAKGADLVALRAKGAAEHLRKIGLESKKSAAQARVATKKVITGYQRVEIALNRVGSAAATAAMKMQAGVVNAASAGAVAAKKTAIAVKSIGVAALAVAPKMKALGRSMTLWLSTPLLLLGGAATKMATDYEESLDKVSVVFGKSAKTVTDFTDNALKKFGLGKNAAIEMTSLFGDMAVGMKIPQEEAAKLAIETAKLAADTASLKNVPLGEIQTAFAGIFTGETESMKRIGVMLQQKNIQDWMKGKGIRGQFKEMQAAEQVQIRFRFAQDMLSKAVGNFELTSESAANKSRTFKESVNDLGIVFGREILPLFVKVIDKLTELTQWFSKLDESTKETIIIIGGLLAVLGPLLYILGQVVVVTQALGVALKFLAFNPVIVAGMAFVGVLTLIFVKMSTLQAYFEESITQWVIWFKELGVVIVESVVNSLNWVIEKVNSVLGFLGQDPIKIQFEPELASSGLKRDIRNLEEQKAGIDFAAAEKQDKQRVGDLLKSYGLDLPEKTQTISSDPTTPEGPTKGPRKSRVRKSRSGRGGRFSQAERETTGADIDRKLAAMAGASQGRASGGGTTNQTVHQNITVNARSASPSGVVKELERTMKRSIPAIAPASQ
jgi:hypothetical protein